MTLDRTLITAKAAVSSGPDFDGPAGVVIEGNRILAIGPVEQMSVHGPFAAVIGDSSRHIVVPGLVNAHHHSFRPNRRAGTTGISELHLAQMRRRKLPSLSPDEIALHSTWTASKLLLSGVTTFADGFPNDPRLPDFGLEASIDAYLRSGLRVAVFARLSDQCTFAYEPDHVFLDRLPEPIRGEVSGSLRPFDPTHFFEVWNSVSDAYDGLNGRIRIGLGPTGDLWCSDDLLRRIKAEADHRSSPIQTHLLFSPFQVVASDRLFGKSCVQRLTDLGFLGRNVSLAHAGWVAQGDMDLLARSGATVVHCPGSNLSSGLGVAPVPEFLESGCAVALGLDGAGFDPSFDMFVEMRLALQLHRRPGPGGRGLSSMDVFRMATSSAHEALGMPIRIGLLEAGAAADLVLLDAHAIGLPPYADQSPPVRLTVGAATAAAVDVVIVDGVIRVEGGSLVGVDIDAVTSQVRECVDRVDPLLEEADREFRSLEPYIQAHFNEYDLEAAGIRLSPYGFS